MVNTMMMMDDMMVRALDPADPAICGIQVIYDADLMPMTEADADAQAQARGNADLTPMTDADANAHDNLAPQEAPQKAPQEAPRSLRSIFFNNPYWDGDPPTERDFMNWMDFMSGQG